MNGLGIGMWRNTGAATPFIAAAAPSGLTVTIAEASLGFGDTATASVSVSGTPAPTLAYQWTLDGVDAEGQTGPTFEGVPVGALRVRVTATNSEGVAGPVTSLPVTVTALAPGAFSAGQWAMDATGVSGEIVITLFGLPPENGAAITSVEHAVSTQRKSWFSTTASQDWSGAQQVAPFMANNSPWNLASKAGSDWAVSVAYGGPSGLKLYSRTSALPMDVGQVAGAPFVALGKHYNEATTVNPFMQDGLIGLRSDAITDFTAAATWTDLSTDPDRSWLGAIQLYGSVLRTQSFDWNNAGASFFDIQIRLSAANVVNFPAMTGTNSYTATIGGVSWNVVRSITTWQGANTRSYGFQPVSGEASEAPCKAVIDWIVANEVANFAQADAYIWLYGVQAWVEPRAGVTDLTISDFAVALNGVEYSSHLAWIALPSLALNSANNLTGFVDGRMVDATLRAVNSVGAGPGSDIKTEAPFAPVAPAMLGNNEWTFQPVAASTDLEVSIAQTADWTGFSLNVDASGAVSASYTALNAGPVNLAVPTISGTPALGATMTADTGRWATLPGVTSYAYQWKRNGVAISGATASTYNLVSADASTNLSVVVTPTDAQGTPAAGGAESVATAIGAFAPATPDLFAVAVGALRNANAFDMGDAAWTNDGSTTITALAADGPYLAPQTITVSVAQTFRGRKTSLGTLANAAVYRCAAMVKAGVGNRCQILLESGANNATVYTTDVGGVGALTVTHSATRPGTITNEVIEDAGGGYRRIRFDYTPNAAATHTIKTSPFANVVGASVDVYGCGAAEQA